MEVTAEQICKNFKAEQGNRQNFDTYYQKLHDYYDVEGQNVNKTYSAGTELDFQYLTDSISLEVADVLAAGLSNYLTPAASKWLYLEHSNPALRELKPVVKWMQEVTDEVNLVLARSNFYNQMPIFYKDSGVYGTAFLMIEDDPDDDVRFYNLPIKNTYMNEDAREKPYEFYLKVEYTAEQAVTKFGIDKVSNDIKEAFEGGRNPEKKYEFIAYFGHRQDIDVDKFDKENMPIRLVWVDSKSKQIMMEDSFLQMPVVAHRFYKRPQIAYGFSPAMKALPYVRYVNTIADTVMRASMKATDPAIAMPHNSFLGAPNFNPRVINYYKKGRLDPQKDIMPIGNYGNPAVGLAEIEYYSQRIKDLMFNNAFQLFSNNIKDLNVPQTMEMMNEKMTLLGPAVGRFMSDALQPAIEKVVTMLFNKGKLPELPAEMANDPRFEVKFTGRLVQAQRQAELSNINNSLLVAGQVAQFKPEVLDKINADEILNKVWSINGTDIDTLYSEQEVNEMRQAQAQMMQQQMQMQALEQGANIAKTATEAEKNINAS